MATPQTDPAPLKSGRRTLVVGGLMALFAAFGLRVGVLAAADRWPQAAAWAVRISDLVTGSSAVFITIALLISLVTDDGALTRLLRRSIRVGSVVRDVSGEATSRARKWARRFPILMVVTAFYLLAGTILDRGLPDWRESVEVGQLRWFATGYIATTASLYLVARYARRRGA